MVGIWNFSSILILLFFFGNHMSMSGAMWCYITMYRFDSHCTLVILFVFFLHDCRLTSLKYLLLRIWGTLTASWNIVGIEALMMSMAIIFSMTSSVVITHHTHFLICTSLQAQEEREKVKTQIEKDINWCPAVSTLHLQLMFDHVPFSSLLLNAFSAATARDHMVEQCPCVKINYKNAVVRTSATPSTLLFTCMLPH